MCFMHIDQLDTLDKSYGSKNSSWVIVVTGVKRSFSPKCYNSLILNSLNAKLIHVHLFEIICLFCGVTGQSGFIWGHRGQKITFAKNAIKHTFLHSMTT